MTIFLAQAPHGTQATSKNEVCNHHESGTFTGFRGCLEYGSYCVASSKKKCTARYVDFVSHMLDLFCKCQFGCAQKGNLTKTLHR